MCYSREQVEILVRPLEVHSCRFRKHLERNQLLVWKIVPIRFEVRWTCKQVIEKRIFLSKSHLHERWRKISITKRKPWYVDQWMQYHRQVWIFVRIPIIDHNHRQKWNHSSHKSPLAIHPHHRSREYFNPNDRKYQARSLFLGKANIVRIMKESIPNFIVVNQRLHQKINNKPMLYPIKKWIHWPWHK